MNKKYKYKAAAVLVLTIFLSGLTFSLFQFQRIRGAGLIHLTQAVVGNGPYYLDQADTEYILDEDLIFPGTGLIVTKKNIVLNLNGKTLKFGNTIVPDIPNHSFESPDLSNWTFVKGPESQSTITRTPTTNYPMMGDYYMKASNLLGNANSQDEIISDWIALPENGVNRTYAGGMIMRSGCRTVGSDCISMVLEVSIDRKHRDGQIETYKTQSWSGLDHAPVVNAEFKPDNVVDYTYRLHIKIVDTKGYTFNANFDYASIKPAWDTGVIIADADLDIRYYPDIPPIASHVTRPGGDNFVMKGRTVDSLEADENDENNGVVEEVGGGIHSFGVRKQSDGPMSMFEVTSKISGISSSNIQSGWVRWLPVYPDHPEWNDLYPGEYNDVHHNLLENTSKYVVIRDALDGFPAHLGTHTSFHDNKIRGGQGGIRASQQEQVNIYDNDIKIRQYVTNHYAIETYGGKDIEIYNNNINNAEEDYWGRGIHMGEGSQRISVHDNNLSIRVLNNPEYPSGHGSHGIKLESTDDSEVYNNTVTVFSRNLNYAAALDIDSGGKTNSIHNNKFIAIGDPSFQYHAQAIKMTGGGDCSGLEIKDNIFVANDYMIDLTYGGSSNLSFVNNTFACGESVFDRCISLPSQFRTVNIGYSAKNDAGLKIVNPTLEGGVDFGDIGRVNINPSDLSTLTFEYFIQWPMKFKVIDQGGDALANATVTAESSNGTFLGTTDSNGEVTINLSEKKIYGQKVYGTSANAAILNPYSVIASKADYIPSDSANYNANLITSANIITIPIALETEGNDRTPPTTPANLAAPSITNTAVNLSWDQSTDNFNVSGYKIFKDNVLINSIGASATPSYQDTATNAVDDAGQTYLYKVVAYDLMGNLSSPASLTVNIPDSTLPSTPSDLRVSLTENSISLTWSPSSDNVSIENYLIYKDNAEFAESADIEFSDTDIAPGHTYTYSVYAVDPSGNKSGANTLSVQVPDSLAPTPPETVNASINGDKVDLSWSAASDNGIITGYKIYRNGAYFATASGTAYLDSGLQPSMIYEYKVIAYDSTGNESVPTNPLLFQYLPSAEIITLSSVTPLASASQAQASAASESRNSNGTNSGNDSKTAAEATEEDAASTDQSQTETSIAPDPIDTPPKGALGKITHFLIKNALIILLSVGSAINIYYLVRRLMIQRGRWKI